MAASRVAEQRMDLMAEAATEVGPALFFSLLIITLSFIPVFTLEAQEGRLFAPLAFTKTYAMAAAAGLSVTLIPVLMFYFIRGRIADETRNPLNRVLIALYRPIISVVLRFPWVTLAVAAVVLAATVYPLQRLGSEFMPPLDEGDLLYMPSALPGISAAKASEVLQQTDRIIKQFPEVHSVFGKMGRAETSTDPAPLEMVETTIQFKPKDQWRTGLTTDQLIQEMDRALRIPGLANIWVQPIRNRIDMLATGIKSPVGIKIAGADIDTIQRVGTQIERVVREVPGASSVLAERLSGGRYIEVRIDRLQAARYGLSVADVQAVVAGAIGGENVAETVEGLERFPISVRYPRELRDSLTKLRELPIVTEMGATVPLSMVAAVEIVDGPPMLRSENARLSGWVYVDIRGRDLGSFVTEAQRAVREKVQLPSGYSVSWSGQFEYLERAAKKMRVVVPFTLAIIFVLLFMTFRNFTDALLIMATLPFALVGGFWLLHLLGHNLSIASAVGFIALAGVAAEFGVVMVIYLNQAVERWQRRGATHRPPRTRSGHRRRRRVARAAQGDDRGGDRGRIAAHHARQRHRLGGDAAHRRTNGGRHDYGAGAVDDRAAGGVPPAAWTARAGPRQCTPAGSCARVDRTHWLRQQVVGFKVLAMGMRWYPCGRLKSSTENASSAFDLIAGARKVHVDAAGTRIGSLIHRGRTETCNHPPAEPGGLPVKLDALCDKADHASHSGLATDVEPI